MEQKILFSSNGHLRTALSTHSSADLSYPRLSQVGGTAHVWAFAENAEKAVVNNSIAPIVILQFLFMVFLLNQLFYLSSDPVPVLRFDPASQRSAAPVIVQVITSYCTADRTIFSRTVFQCATDPGRTLI